MWERGLESKFSFFLFRFGLELLFLLFFPHFFLEVLGTSVALESLPLTEPQPRLFPLSSLCSIPPVASLFASSQGQGLGLGSDSSGQGAVGVADCRWKEILRVSS